MAGYRPASPPQEAFMARLIASGLLVETGVPGVYGRSAVFEDVRLAFEALVTRTAAVDHPESLRFPPLLPRHQLEQIGYLKSFPHLAGTIFSFEGSEGEAVTQFEKASRHEDWAEHQSMTDLVLTPAACYPVYPAIAKRGPLPPGGICVDAGGADVFRHEPSGDPARMQMFHQREIVRIAEPDTVAEWRDAWRDRAVTLLASIGVIAEPDVANDPFFGRSGRMLAASQRQQELKFELLCVIVGDEPTAIASFNCHQEHFSSVYGIEMADGSLAHTACLGFGEERVTLALLATHGFEPGNWPTTVRAELWPE